MTEAEARRRFAAAPVARLATVTPAGLPHIVPIVFVLDSTGTASTAGTAGTADTTGIVGTTGVAGIAGTTGAAGIAGTAGTPGTAGTAGTPGTAGTVDTIYHGVDAKPKRRTDLRRMANLDADPHASVLVDHYEDDWDALWWVRADGIARDVDPAGPEGRRAVALLEARFPRYELRGRLLAITVTHWSSWSARA